MDLNELPENKDRKVKVDEIPAPQPEPRAANALLKMAGFLAVVVVLTGLAINSHYQGSTQATMAPDKPPATEGVSTLPSAPSPIDRGTTGRAPTAPGVAPNSPSEAAAGANSNN